MKTTHYTLHTTHYTLHTTHYKLRLTMEWGVFGSPASDTMGWLFLERSLFSSSEVVQATHKHGFGYT